MKLSDIDILEDGKDSTGLMEKLAIFNRTDKEYRSDAALHQVFMEQAEATPDAAAVVSGQEVLSYRELDRRSNQLAGLLTKQPIAIGTESFAAILMEPRPEMITAMIGILKAGAAYCPLSPDTPLERLKFILADAGVKVLISSRRYMGLMNRLQWEVAGLDTVLCLDSNDFYSEIEQPGELMNQELWDYVGEEAFDEISAGGWKSSYTGQWLSREVMEGYSRNIKDKLLPYINKETRILEIGCASGISMFALAPLCQLYYGTDLSANIIEWTAREVQKRKQTGINETIRLKQLPAHRIGELEEKAFDMVVINSVIQNFSGLNYLRQVIAQTIALIKEKGILFIGDIWDQDLKADFIRSLVEFKRKHAGEGIRTKTDRSSELFVSRRFFEDLSLDFPEIAGVEFSHIQASESEISGFGFDLLMRIDKHPEAASNQATPAAARHKRQLDVTALQRFPGTAIEKPTPSSGLCYLLYTSGSTGTPKGVMIEHRSVMNLVSSLDRFYEPFKGPLHVVLTASYTFDASVQQIFAALLRGHSLHLAQVQVKRDGPRYVSFLQKHAIDIGDGTPSLFSVIAGQCNKKGTACGVKHFIIGGEAFTVDLARSFYRLPAHGGVTISNVYGPTECTVDATYFSMNSENYKHLTRIPIGKPMNNTGIFIMDERQRLQPVNVPGEICIAGHGVARGYLKDAELTNTRFIAVPPSIRAIFDKTDSGSFLVNREQQGSEAVLYRTGDLGRWLEDGNLEFLGRSDDQVKIRGYRIELGEIEYWLRQHDMIDEAVVLSIDLGSQSPELAAYIKAVKNNGAANQELNINMLREYLGIHLNDYMLPSYFVAVETFKLTPNGKIDKKALPSPAQAALASGTEYAPPSSDTEQTLVELWQDILGLSRIGIDDNFFDIGGHSLLAVRLMSRIEDTFGQSIALSALFSQSTIRQLAALLDGRLQALPWSPLVELQGLSTSARPPLFCFHPVGGSVFCYRELSNQLGEYQPFYVLQALGLEEGQEPLESVEEMAAYYIRQIKEVQPQGPYLLAGWSFGGLVAFETAQQLRSAGEAVALVALIDSTAVKSAIEDVMSKDDAGFLADFFSDMMTLDEHQLRSMNPEEQIAYLVEQARAQQVITDDFGIPQATRLIKVFKNNGRSIVNYELKPYNGPVHLFRPEHESHMAYSGSDSLTLGWEKLARGGIHAVHVPGDHGTMLMMPHVKVLAEKMEDAIGQSLDQFYLGPSSQEEHNE